jgi:serine/threonine-protein kinase
MARALVVLALLWFPALAAAQDSAAARALFDEGKRLVEQGDFAAACPKFEASLANDVKLGTKLALAACYERTGRTASAWTGFLDAAAMARRAGPSEEARERYAAKQARDLEPKLVRLVIAVPEPTPGLEVTRGGSPVVPATFGVPVPVDPGDHEIVAAAEGRQRWTQLVRVGLEPVTTVTVPPLPPIEAPVVTAPPPASDSEPAPLAAAPPPEPVDEAPARTPTMRWVGYGVGAAGVALVGVGLYFGASAMSKWNDAKSMCVGDTEPLSCTAEGVTLRDDAAGAATLSTITVGVGAAAIAGGVLLVLLNPPRREGVAISPTVGTGGVGVAVSGSF